MSLLSAIVAFGLALFANASIVNMEGLPDTGLNTTTWVKGVAPPIAQLVDLNDFQFAAQNTLSGSSYAYYRTAAFDEITYNRNMLDWAKIRLNGFTFQDVSTVNLKTTILGYQFNAPFFIAPAAKAGLANAGAETNLVKAAGASGILYVPSIEATQTSPQIAAARVANQILFHQEYVWANQTLLMQQLTEFQADGYKAVFLTVDNTGVLGIRDRQLRFSAGTGGEPHDLTFTLQDLINLRSLTSLPIVPKGVKTAQDVRKVADAGFPAVYISNHGGRVVDFAPKAVEILLDLHANSPAIFNQLEIYCDGGVRHADHILILIALGCRAVGIGRPPMYANVYGQPGVQKVITNLAQEMVTLMRLMGQSNIDGYRGNTTFINTRQIELEYFGAPLTVSTASNPKVIAPVARPSGDNWPPANIPGVSLGASSG